MQVVYTGEVAPSVITKSIFLAGPSPRKDSDINWRPHAINILQDLGFDGVVFDPTWRNQPGQWPPQQPDGKPFDYDGQVSWETKYLNACDLVVFWVPRDMKFAPALTTNVEFGIWLTSGKALLGYPKGASHMTYLDWQGQHEGVPIHSTLGSLLKDAVDRLANGADRTGGEQEVPLHLWVKPEFQSWYSAQKAVGNRIDGAKVVWSFRVGKHKERIFLWALHVDVWIKAENRHKTNEVLILRPDVSTIIAFCRPEQGNKTPLYIKETEIVLVREFRSPVNNSLAMVVEVPGGSSSKAGVEPEVTASEEMYEETGFRVAADRFIPIGVRQIAATLSTHKAHVYAVEMTRNEMLSLKWDAGKVHGNEVDTERTYVEVTTVGTMLKSDLVDWSNIGMILAALMG